VQTIGRGGDQDDRDTFEAPDERAHMSPPPGKGAAATVEDIVRTERRDDASESRPQTRSKCEGSIQRVAGRDGYRAQLTLPDGRRPVGQFKAKQQAADWFPHSERSQTPGISNAAMRQAPAASGRRHSSRGR
jgi:hypothetical protein